MPCIYCKTIHSPNSSTHTLSNCEESADEVIGPIVTLVTEHTHDILKQSRDLSRYSKGQLAMACKQFDTYFSGSKTSLIVSIVKKFFLHQVIRNISSINDRTFRTFTASYDAIFADEPGELRTTLLDIMEIFYCRVYGIRRNGEVWNTYYAAYNRSRNAYRAGAAENIRANMRDRAYARARAHAIVSAEVRARAAGTAYNPSSHLKKLSIQIAVVQVQNKECDICCDSENPIAKMGCSHEFCVGCVNKICSSRTKSFISCPMCRAEISSIQVSNSEISQNLNNHILSC